MVCKRQGSDYNHLIVMLRGMKALNPDAYVEVTCTARLSSSSTQSFCSLQIPETYKVGLKNEEHFALVAAERTQEKVAERAAVVASNPSWTDLPWTAAELETHLDPVHTRFGEIIENNIVSHRFCFVFCCCTV